MGLARTVVLAINGVTAVLGAVLMGIGGYAYLSNRVPIATPEYMLGIAAVGLCVFVMSAIGYFGAKNENKRLVFLYVILVTLLAGIQVLMIVMVQQQATTLEEIAAGGTIRKSSGDDVADDAVIADETEAEAAARRMQDAAKAMLQDYLVASYESCCYEYEEGKFDSSDKGCLAMKRTRLPFLMGQSCDVRNNLVRAGMEEARCGTCPPYQLCSACEHCKICYLQRTEPLTDDSHKNFEPTCLAMTQMTYNPKAGQKKGSDSEGGGDGRRLRARRLDEAEAEGVAVLSSKTCKGGAGELAGAIAAWVKDNFKPLLAMAIVFAIIQLAAIMASCALLFSKNYSPEWNSGGSVGPALG